MEEGVDDVDDPCLGRVDLRDALLPGVLQVERLPELQECLDDLGLFLAFERLDDVEDERVGLDLHVLDRDRRTRLGRVLESRDERPDLVQDRRRLIEEFANVGGLEVLAGEAEDVVHALGRLAVVEVVRQVLAHLLLEALDVVIERVVGDELGDLGEHRGVLGVEVDLLEERVEIAVEGHDLTVRRLPGHVNDVARVGQLASFRVAHDPVEFAPAGIEGDLVPAQGRLAIGAAHDQLLGLDLVERPADRASLAHTVAGMGPVEGVVSELRLEELVGVALPRREHLVPHELRHHGACRLAGRRLDVESLEVVGVARETLDLGLRCGPGERECALDVWSRARHFDDLPDATEPLEVARAEVQHGDPVAEGAALKVDDDVARRRLLGDRVHPPERLLLLDLESEPFGGFDDAFDVGGAVGGLGGGHDFLRFLVGGCRRVCASAAIAAKSMAWSCASPSALWESGRPSR